MVSIPYVKNYIIFRFYFFLSLFLWGIFCIYFFFTKDIHSMLYVTDRKLILPNKKINLKKTDVRDDK